jgi:N-acetylmuramoyl-L-alanine amidase
MRMHMATMPVIALAMHVSYALHPASAQSIAAVPAKPAAASAKTAAAVAPKAAPSMCDRHTFRLVVDVGHGSRAPGALSARGIYEYEFNLRLAKEIDQKLKDTGFERTVLLITPDPPRLGLFKRTEKANALAPDLFLSIHHDSVPDSFLEKWEYQGEQHAYSDRFPGHSIFISYDNPNRGRSLEFAMLIGSQLKSRGLKYTPHYTEHFMGHHRRELVDAETGVYRYDQLVVLRSTHMPAVLLEAGSIVNRNEELELDKPERRALISDAVTAAVESYCESRGEHIAGSPAHPPHTPSASAHAAKATAPKSTKTAHP